MLYATNLVSALDVWKHYDRTNLLQFCKLAKVIYSRRVAQQLVPVELKPNCASEHDQKRKFKHGTNLKKTHCQFSLKTNKQNPPKLNILGFLEIRTNQTYFFYINNSPLSGNVPSTLIISKISAGKLQKCFFLSLHLLRMTAFCLKPVSAVCQWFCPQPLPQGVSHKREDSFIKKYITLAGNFGGGCDD